MLRWSGQNANQKVGPDKMPTMEKKSRTKCQPRLAFCPVGILSGWHLVLPPLNIWLQNINLGQDGDNGESNADDKVDGGEELVKLALARVLPGVVGD